MIDPTSLIITMDDCRKAGHCASGVRRWFNESGLNFRSFMATGTSAAEILAVDDALGRQVVARTVQRRLLADQPVSEAMALEMLKGGI